jgi:hypothetical protein
MTFPNYRGMTAKTKKQDDCYFNAIYLSEKSHPVPDWVCSFLIWQILSSPILDVGGTDPLGWGVLDFAAGSPLAPADL